MPPSSPLTVFAPYFTALKKKIRGLAIVFGVFFVIGFIEAGKLIRIFLGFFKLSDITITTTSPFQLLNLSTSTAMIIGATAFFIVLIFHTYRFMKGGLRKNERALFFLLSGAGILLFIVGVMYGFGILSMYLISVSKLNLGIGIKNYWDIGSFLSQTILTSVFLGFVFQFPVILTFLIRMGVLKVDVLRKKRKIAFALIFIFVGFLPPPDILSTFLEAFPLIVLYELAIRANMKFARKQEQALLLEMESLSE